MAVVRVRRGQITIPAALRRAANLKDGDAFAVSLDDEGTLTLRPSVCEEEEHPASDWRYWSDPVRVARSATSEPAVGPFSSIETFFAYLDSEEPNSESL